MLIRYNEVLKSRPASLLKEQKRLLQDDDQALRKALKNRMSNDRQKLDHFQKIVNILHPLNTMKRGFSVTRSKDGQVIKKAAQVRVQEEIFTEMADGNIESNVQKVNKGGTSWQK